jgi:integrase
MLAEMKVREFVVGDLDELLMAIKSKRTPKKGKRTPKTLREVMAHFRQLLDFAVLKGCVSMNVFRQLASGLDYGDSDKKKLTKISEDIIHKIAKNIAPLGANAICQRKLMYLFSAYTGLRSGEMRALEWSDVDLENEEINVNKVIHYKRYYSVDAKGKRKEKGKFNIRHSTKSEKGMRNVTIVKWLASMLKEFKLEQGQPSGRVFPSSTGGVLSGTRLREYLQEACERANVERIRWHDLRHYYASILLKVYGGDFNRIKTYMGHASIKTTIDTYSHWIENLEEKREAKDKLNESLGKFGAMV